MQVCKDDLFQLYIMNKWLVLDDITTYYSHEWEDELTQGQGHKVKGQGQTNSYVKIFVRQ